LSNFDSFPYGIGISLFKMTRLIMKRYRIVLEKTDTGYSAYSPDLDGCVATGKTPEHVEFEMCEAIAFHLEGMTRVGRTSPSP
jgi:predicted RNase H-like HicB family nuclease